MSTVQELDKTLFESYVKPKAIVVKDLVKSGILDKGMDWYETPQPTGKCIPYLVDVLSAKIVSNRDTSVHVSHGGLPCRRSRPGF